MNFPALLAITFLTSAAGLVVEIVAGRMMAPFFGMSLQTWTVVISVVLLGFSLGHAFGGRVADMERRKAWSLTGTALFIAAASTALAETAMAAIAATPGKTSLLSMSAAGLAFFVPSFCVAFPTPFITKAAVEGGGGVSGRALGLVYGASSLGAIAGSVSAGFYLVPVIGSSATMSLVAVLYLCIAVCAWMAAGVALKRAAHVCAAATFLGAGLWGGGFMSAWCEVETSYYCIRHDEVADGGSRLRRLIINQGVHSAIDLDAPGRQPLAYAEQISQSVKEYARKSGFDRGAMLFIGGGGYTIPADVARELPGWTVQVAEIDPAVTAFVERVFPEVPLGSFAIRHEDGRLALGAMEDGSLDLVILDAFSDISVPEHLTTVEFMELAARKLKAGGLLLANVIDRADRPLFLASLARTSRGALPETAVFREPKDADGNGLANYVAAFARDEAALPEAGTGKMLRFPFASVVDVEAASVQTDDRSDVGFLVRR